MLDFIKNLFKSKKISKKEKIISALTAFAYIYGMGWAGSSEPDTFYAGLAKSPLTPPNWVFPVVWLLLFAMIGIAGYWAWNYYEDDAKRKFFMALYFLNGILVYQWSELFFGKNNPLSALILIIGMIVVIQGMLIIGYLLNKKSGLILLPYFLWVMFASYLNVMIVALN